jgi:threonine/homoserine/homoserine lactone efflux protein
MLSFEHVLGFTALAAVLVAIPGPSVLFVVGRAMSTGRRSALLTVVGNAVGLASQVLAVSVGLGSIVERSIVAFTVVKVAGGLYIVYLGIQAIRHRRKLAETIKAGVAVKSTKHVLREGFVVGILNPKTIVFFSAILPQFIDRNRGHVSVQLTILGFIFVAIALLFDSIWALAAGTARTWFERSPKRLSAIGGTGGAIMIGLGARVVLTGRHD